MHRERKIDNTFFTCDVTCFEFEFNYIHSHKKQFKILRNVTSEESTRPKTFKITLRLFHNNTSLKLFLFIKILFICSSPSGCIVVLVKWQRSYFVIFLAVFKRYQNCCTFKSLKCNTLSSWISL